MASKDQQQVACCPLCHDTVEIFAVGPCDHPICYKCSTRMRILCEQNYCPICRADLPKVLFMRSLEKFERVDISPFLKHRDTMIFFDRPDTEDAYLSLLEHRCKLCRGATFRSFKQLCDHMRKEHQLHACDLCVNHVKLFSRDRKFYERSGLARHKRLGDDDDTSYKGHPLCKFCDERYADDDELMRHLRKDHYFCHMCEIGGVSNHEYYCDYGNLREHFAQCHYLCEEGECAGAQFTNAFRSDIDLKAHQATAHSHNLGKSAARQLRTIDIDVNYGSHRPGGGATGSGGGPRGGGGARRRGDDGGGYRGHHEGRNRDFNPHETTDDPRQRDFQERRERREKHRLEVETAHLVSASLAEVQRQGHVSLIHPSLVDNVLPSNPPLPSAPPAVAAPPTNYERTTSADFPTLAGGPSRPLGSSQGPSGGLQEDQGADSLARKVAYSAKHSVGGTLRDADFPMLPEAQSRVAMPGSRRAGDKKATRSAWTCSADEPKQNGTAGGSGGNSARGGQKTMNARDMYDFPTLGVPTLGASRHVPPVLVVTVTAPKVKSFEAKSFVPPPTSTKPLRPTSAAPSRMSGYDFPSLGEASYQPARANWGPTAKVSDGNKSSPLLDRGKKGKTMEKDSSSSSDEAYSSAERSGVTPSKKTLSEVANLLASYDESSIAGGKPKLPQPFEPPWIEADTAKAGGAPEKNKKKKNKVSDLEKSGASVAANNSRVAARVYADYKLQKEVATNEKPATASTDTKPVKKAEKANTVVHVGAVSQTAEKGQGNETVSALDKNKPVSQGGTKKAGKSAMLEDSSDKSEDVVKPAANSAKKEVSKVAMDAKTEKNGDKKKEDLKSKKKSKEKPEASDEPSSLAAVRMLTVVSEVQLTNGDLSESKPLQLKSPDVDEVSDIVNIITEPAPNFSLDEFPSLVSLKSVRPFSVHVAVEKQEDSIKLEKSVVEKYASKQNLDVTGLRNSIKTTDVCKSENDSKVKVVASDVPCADKVKSGNSSPSVIQKDQKPHITVNIDRPVTQTSAADPETLQLVAESSVMDTDNFPALGIRVRLTNGAVSDPACADLKSNEAASSSEPLTAEPPVSFTLHDFPSLLPASAPRPFSVPPGFSAKPPPGFEVQMTVNAASAAASTKITKPPPGFAAPSFVSVAAKPSVATHLDALDLTYHPPTNADARNQLLFARIQSALSDGFATFVTFSGKFRNDEIPPDAYYAQCRAIMGAENFAGVFPELVALLPDVEKQQQLLAAHRAAAGGGSSSGGRARGGGTPWGGEGSEVLASCPQCGQVLVDSDVAEHRLKHEGDYPDLGGTGGKGFRGAMRAGQGQIGVW